MAISASVVWEVQTTGSDSNGGGFKTGSTGTDRTYPTSNPQAIVDLKTDGATLTVMVSATYTFVAGDVGNVVSVSVTDSGGFATVGRYEIMSVTAGKATVDRAWASGNNGATDGATAVLGGALATPGQAGKTLSTANQGASGQKIYIKAGTYTLSTGTAGSGGPFVISSTVDSIRVIGYGLVRDDDAGSALIDAGAVTSVTLWYYATVNYIYNLMFRNLSADGNGNAGVNGFATNSSYAISPWFVNCVVSNCSAAGCYGIISANGNAISCNAVNCATGIATTTAECCSAVGCSTYGFSGQSFASHCLAYGCGSGFYTTGSTRFFKCTADGNTSYGFNVQAYSVTFVDCLASNHSGAGDAGFYASSASYVSLMLDCAGWNNTTHTSGAGIDFAKTFVTLTADPYVSQATADFRPNNTAGGGAALRSAGIGVYGQTDNRDIGAVQHSDSASGGGGLIIGSSIIRGR